MTGLSFKKNSRNQKLLKALSGTHVSKSGYEYEFEQDKWRIGTDYTVNFNALPEVSQEFELGLRATVSRYAEEQSHAYVRVIYETIKSYLRNTQEKSISIKGLSSMKADLGKEKEYKLGSIVAFLLSWAEWGYPGIDEDVEKYLEEQTFSGGKKGQAVLKKCPYTGPYTALEQSAIIDWSGNAFSEGDIELVHYAFLITLLFTGRRAVQLRALRACDISFSETSSGRMYELNVPRAKQRGQGFRESSKPIEITEDLYLLLKNLIDESIERIEKRFGAKASDVLRSELPIFINWGRLEKCPSIHEVESLLTGRKPDYLHPTGHQAGEYMQTISRKSTAMSERTGDFIHYGSRRFRYTKGTNLARRGIAGPPLSEALDHSDQQHIGVYTANTPEHADRISDIMADTLAPLAQAFVGTLIDSERDALRANDPHSRVKNNHSNDVGSCGTHGFCASGYRACYTCIKFQPWRDAPHQEVLEEILKERETQKEAGVSEHVIQSTDRLLLAVTQVIQLCEKAKAETLKEAANV
ncbi:MAG: site-specific integrase [Candidatus Thiodiazotropha endolucinida]